jgi:hypothetical protein
LGLKDQTCKFAEQRLRLRQRQAQLLRTKPCDTTFEPANLDCLHIAPAASGLELEHPFHDRLPPTEETIFTVPRPDDQNFSTPGCVVQFVFGIMLINILAITNALIGMFVA